MKQYIILLFVVSTLAGCEEFKNSAVESQVTYLPKVEMQGDAVIDLECDAAGYDDEGVTMTEGGAALEVETVVTGTFFGGTAIDGPDFYEIAYSAVNKDGIPGTAIREVNWPECNGDLTTSLAGMYSSDLVRKAHPGGAAAGTYSDVGPIIIRDLGNDVYQISDMLGGWYVYGRALGYTYGAPGATITVNDMASNDFTHDDVVEVLTFGGNAKITDFSVDAGAGTIEYSVEWDAGYTFDVTLTQID